MSNLDVLAFVVWGGGLFNVGFLAGWFAGRRRLRQSDGEAKRFALQGREPVSVLRVAESDLRVSRRRRSEKNCLLFGASLAARQLDHMFFAWMATIWNINVRRLNNLYRATRFQNRY
jgi:hypothetical protein